ncbi:MAG: DUF2339 domain-containing protein, partial [Planctomycetota bacterium]
MDEQDINRELRKLAARLARIEARLGIWQPVDPIPPASTDARAHVTASEAQAPPECPQAHLPDEYVKPPEPATELPFWDRDLKTATTVTPEPSTPRRSLEVLIAERWMAWVGALVIVVAAGFFIKLAYDMGWWGRIPDIGKCTLAGVFGALLLVGGEIALRRVGRPAAASLFGAGLGVLYMTAFATFHYFHLLPRAGAFGLMALVAVLGMAITVRGRLLAIGVLSLLGGYLSPILLAEQATFAAALPLYVTALMLVALGLSAKWPTEFRVLRYVGFGLHVVVATLWLIQEGVDHWVVALVFLTLWWAMVNAEALWAALRGQSPRGNPIATLLVTLWYVSAGCGLLATVEPGARNWLGLFAGAVAAVCAWLALGFGPGVAVLKIRPRRALELQTATLWAQVGVLAVAAVALHFRDPGESYGQTISWLAMALACVEVGRRLPSRAVGGFGLVIGLLALCRVWVIDRELVVLHTVFWSYGDVLIDYWALIALAGIAVTHVVALRWPSEEAWGGTSWPKGLCVLSILQWLVLVGLRCDELAVTSGWLLAVAGLLAGALVIKRCGYLGIATVVLCLCAGKWIVVDATLSRLVQNWNPQAVTPVFNWQMALALAISLCGYWCYRLREKMSANRGARGPQVILVSAVCFLLVALSFEVDTLIARAEMAGTIAAVWAPLHTRVLWWTLLWGLGGLVSWLCGRGWGLTLLRESGLVLLVSGAVVWLSLGTLLPRFEHGVTLCPVVLNTQFGVGLALSGLLAVVLYVLWRFDFAALKDNATLRGVAQIGIALVLAIGLWQVSLELDR